MTARAIEMLGDRPYFLNNDIQEANRYYAHMDNGQDVEAVLCRLEEGTALYVDSPWSRSRWQ